MAKLKITKAVCPPDNLAQAVEAAKGSATAGIVHIDHLLEAYGGDSRLHFLRGSLFEEAHAAMVRAIELSPEFTIARFQLGLLELSSGRPAEAEVAWRPLLALPPDYGLRLFVMGLHHLIREEFEETKAFLTRGIAANTDFPPVNRDMQLILDRLETLGAPPPTEPPPAANESVSAAHLLLKRYGKGTKH